MHIEDANRKTFRRRAHEEMITTDTVWTIADLQDPSDENRGYEEKKYAPLLQEYPIAQ